MSLTCDGELIQNADGTIACTGQWLQTEPPIQQLIALFDATFSTPTPEAIGAAWMAGFALPVICYLAAFGFGVVINFFRSPGELE